MYPQLFPIQDCGLSLLYTFSHCNIVIQIGQGPLDKTEQLQQLCHPDNLLELIPDEKVTKRFCEY